MLNDVHCPNTTQCYAVGRYGKSGPGVIIGSSDGGGRWKVLLTTSGAPLSAIACPTADRCVAGGDTLSSSTDIPATFVTTDDGAHWSSEARPPVGGADGAACSSVNVCLIVGMFGLDRTTNAGMTWMMENLPRGIQSIASVACPTRSLCIIGGTGTVRGPTSDGVFFEPPAVDLVSHDAGATWSRAVLASGPLHTGGVASQLSAISCSDADRCVGVITSNQPNSFVAGLPVTTADAGGTWRRGTTRIGLTVSCVKNFCGSVGGHFQDPATADGPTGDGFVSTDGGVTWSQTITPTNQILTGVSCPSPMHCVAIGGLFPTARSAVIMTYP